MLPAVKSKQKRITLLLVGGLGALLLASPLAVRLRYGGGEPYPDVTTDPLVPRTTIVVELDLPAGNVTSSADGRIFFNVHPFAEPHRFVNDFVFELVDGKPRPYPSSEQQSELVGALGMTADRQHRLWIVRPAGIEDRPTRLFGFDLTTNRKIVDESFAEGTGPFAQDLRVAPDGKTIYLADTGIFRFTEPALIVFDVETKRARRVLSGHPSVSPQDWMIRTKHGDHHVGYGLVTFSVGVDGVAVSHDGLWLYYATMSHDSVYRIPTAKLRDSSLGDAELATHIERVGPKPLSDGIEIDAANNVYITDVEHGGVARLSPDGKLETLVESGKVSWADGITLTSDGRALFTDSRIPEYLDQLLRPPSRERLNGAGPHRIYGFALPGATARAPQPH